MATSLEQRNYVATDADIDHIADDILGAQDTMESGPRRYLRAMVATTIHTLDAPQRVRAAKIDKTDEVEQQRQLSAFDTVRNRFYARIVERASVNLPAGKGRAKALNAGTNWARTIAASIRRWIAAGNDIRCLAPAKVIKSTFTLTPQSRAPSPSRVKARVERTSKALMADVMELASADKEAAIAEIRLLLGQLTGQLTELGVTATKDAKAAAAEHRMLRVGKSVFFPTETQVVRQMENPS